MAYSSVNHSCSCDGHETNSRAAGPGGANGTKVLKPAFTLVLILFFRCGTFLRKPHKRQSKRWSLPGLSFQIPKGEQLKKYREKKGKPVSEMIREAVSWFVEKIDYRVDTGVFCLPKTVRDNYTSLTTYFLGSNWDLRVGIFRKTGRCKTDLIREAIRKYWDETG